MGPPFAPSNRHAERRVGKLACGDHDFGEQTQRVGGRRGVEKIEGGVDRAERRRIICRGIDVGQKGQSGPNGEIRVAKVARGVISGGAEISGGGIGSLSQSW